MKKNQLQNRKYILMKYDIHKGYTALLPVVIHVASVTIHVVVLG